jgi:hypothetical protein
VRLQWTGRIGAYLSWRRRHHYRFLSTLIRGRDVMADVLFRERFFRIVNSIITWFCAMPKGGRERPVAEAGELERTYDWLGAAALYTRASVPEADLLRARTCSTKKVSRRIQTYCQSLAPARVGLALLPGKGALSTCGSAFSNQSRTARRLPTPSFSMQQFLRNLSEAHARRQLLGPRDTRARIGWWAGRDLNSRPFGYQPNAQAKLSYRPTERTAKVE